MSIRTTFAAVLAAAAAAAAASTATAATAALTPCAKVAAAGKTWRVLATTKPGCATAERIVHQVAVRKPDLVQRSSGGEIDRYRAPFSGLECFRARKTNVGGQIQCTSKDGAETVLATYRQ